MARLTSLDWTRAALHQLAALGVDGVRVEPLAKLLGASKGSFYWHFANRDALLNSVLDYWEQQGTEAEILLADSLEGDPRERLTTLLSSVFGQPQNDGYELAIRSWARHDDRAKIVVIRVDERRVHYVAGLLEACGVPTDTAVTRSEIAYRMLTGHMVMRAYTGTVLTTSQLQEFEKYLLT